MSLLESCALTEEAEPRKGVHAWQSLYEHRLLQIDNIEEVEKQRLHVVRMNGQKCSKNLLLRIAGMIGHRGHKFGRIQKEVKAELRVSPEERKEFGLRLSKLSNAVGEVCRLD